MIPTAGARKGAAPLVSRRIASSLQTTASHDVRGAINRAHLLLLAAEALAARQCPSCRRDGHPRSASYRRVFSPSSLGRDACVALRAESSIVWPKRLLTR